MAASFPAVVPGTRCDEVAGAVDGCVWEEEVCGWGKELVGGGEDA